MSASFEFIDVDAEKPTKLPDDLIRHCEQKALEAVAADTAGLVRAVLSASGYAELVAALVAMLERFGHHSDTCVKMAADALAATRQPQGSGK